MFCYGLHSLWWNFRSIWHFIYLGRFQVSFLLEKICLIRPRVQTEARKSTSYDKFPQTEQWLKISNAWNREKCQIDPNFFPLFSHWKDKCRWFIWNIETIQCWIATTFKWVDDFLLCWRTFWRKSPGLKRRQKCTIDGKNYFKKLSQVPTESNKQPSFEKNQATVK